MVMGPVLVPLTHWLTPLCARLVVEATATDHHLALSAATRGVVSMGRPLMCRKVRLLASFGRPVFRFPWGVQRRATLGSELGMGHAEDMTKPAPARCLWMVSDIIHIQVLLSSSSFEMTFGQYILKKRRKHLVWKTSSFLRCHKCLPAFWSIPEDAEDVAVEDPDLSVDVKSSGSPYGFEHGKSLVDFADLGLVCFVSLQLWWLCFPAMWIPLRPLVVCYLPVFGCSCVHA